MRKKLLCLILSVCLGGCLFACTPDNPEEKPEEKATVYLDTTKASDYAEVTDFSAYTTYYFDSEAGNDANDGLSETSPKATLQSASATVRRAKTDAPLRVLFKAGSTFNGELTLEGFTAAESTPLIVDAYGKEGEKQYAVISGGSTLVTVKGENVRVSGLELTSPNGKRGINILTAKPGANKNIVISGNYIHDINYDWAAYQEWLGLEAQNRYADERGKMPHEMSDETAICRRPESACPDSNYGYGNGGIFTNNGIGNMSGASWHENVWIENNVIERVARSGMFLDAGWGRRPGHDWGANKYHSDEIGWYPNRNMIVRGNKISYVGGDSIVVLATVGGYIENNVSYHANFLGRGGYYNVGIWPHSCKDLYIQYNESAYTHLDNNGGDGHGFDLDIGCSNIIFRYNYAHHNAGGGILFANVATNEVKYDENGKAVTDADGIPVIERMIPYWGSNVLANNVFADNRKFIQFDGAISDVEIVNNTFITNATRRNYKVIASADPHSSGQPGTSWNFKNNIFVAREETELVFETNFTAYAEFVNNVFFNFKELDVDSKESLANPKDNKTFDPGIVSVAAAKGYESAKAFAAVAEDTYSAGVKLEKANKYDFNGNIVEGVLYAGAFGKK